MDIQELQKIAQFNELDADELAALAKVVQKVQYDKGKYLYKEKKPAHNFYLLCQGQIRREKFSPKKQEQKINVVKPGAYLGNFSMSADARYKEDSIALTDCIVLVFPWAEFSDFSAKEPRIAAKIIKSIIIYLCHLSRKMDEKYVDVVYYMIDG